MSTGSPRWKEKFDRMKRWQHRLATFPKVNEGLVDYYYAFFECAYHLKDWLKADVTLNGVLDPKEVEAHINSRLWLKICADIANGSKHLVRIKPPKVDAGARVSVPPSAFQESAFQVDAFQTAKVIVKVKDQRHDALMVVNECVREWETFLRSKGLISST